MSNPTQTERSGVVRVLRVGGLTLGAQDMGLQLRERHFFPNRIPGGGLHRYGWGPARTTRAATLFVLYPVATASWGWGWRPTGLTHRLWGLLWALHLRG